MKVNDTGVNIDFLELHVLCVTPIFTIFLFLKKYASIETSVVLMMCSMLVILIRRAISMLRNYMPINFLNHNM